MIGVETYCKQTQQGPENVLKSFKGPDNVLKGSKANDGVSNEKQIKALGLKFAIKCTKTNSQNQKQQMFTAANICSRK